MKDNALHLAMNERHTVLSPFNATNKPAAKQANDPTVDFALIPKQWV